MGLPKRAPEPADGRLGERAGAVIFKFRDLVTTPRESDWLGEVLDTSRLQSHGLVTVQWRTSSWTSFESREEQAELLVLLPASHGGLTAREPARHWGGALCERSLILRSHPFMNSA